MAAWLGYRHTDFVATKLFTTEPCFVISLQKSDTSLQRTTAWLQSDLILSRTTQNQGGTTTMALFSLSVNGQSRECDVATSTPLLWVLRDTLQLTGTKYGCGMGLCGACTVHIEGQAVRSCQTPVSAVGRKKITTIEGLSSDRSHPVQRAWIAEQVPQCGYCQSGQIMQAAAFLAQTPHPTRAQIDQAMSGNICRCATYQRIRRAIERAAQE